MDLLRLPVFAELSRARNVLVAGAGGGFVMLCGLPLYFGLREAGRRVHVANLSFAALDAPSGRRAPRALVKVSADTEGWGSYFPELHLARWFRDRGDEVPVYAFRKTGVRPLSAVYEALADHLARDTGVLVG